VCRVQVVNAEITYSADFRFINVSVGNTVYTQGSMDSIKINKTDNVAMSTKVRCIITGNSAGNTFNETSPLLLTFNWYNDTNSNSIDNNLPNYSEYITPGEEVTININKMFEYAFTNKILGISYTIGGKT
jgi:hypothetical protein